MGLNKDRVLNLLLAFLVILSFFLSYKLWTAGRNIGEEENISEQTARSNVSLTTHSKSDVFRPTSVALHGVDNEVQTLVGRTYPLRNLLREQFDQRTLSQIESSTVIGFEEYVDQLQSGRWVEFIYNEEQPLGMLQQKFEELPRDMANNFFDRVIVDLNNPNTVFFYHTDSGSMHEASTLTEEGIDVNPFLNEQNIDYMSAFPLILENNIIYLSNEPIELPNKSFVVDRLQNSVYIENFFPDTSSVDRRSNANITRFIDLTKEVSINQNIHTLNYLRQISDIGELDSTSRFDRSYEQVNRFENWADTFVLSAYDREEQMIYFQREIDGYPVFSLNGYETVSEVGLVESGVTHLKLPLRFINTPITIPGAPSRELMSGDEVLNRINENTSVIDFDQIDDLTVGYAWDESEESIDVIDFNPEWFISVDGVWMTLDEFLGLHEEEAGATYGL